MSQKFAEVIVPVSLPQLFTYTIPETSQFLCDVGSRVVVSFGKTKLYSGVVHRIFDEPPQQSFEIKDIIEVLDSTPIINTIQLRFWDWIAAYYLCSVGEVYRAAVPSSLKLESETVIYRTSKPIDFQDLSPKEINFLGIFNDKVQEIELTKVSKYTGLKNNISLVKNLLSKNYLVSDKIIQDKFQAKTEKYIVLSENITNEEQLRNIFDILEKKAPKQLEVFVFYLSYSGYKMLNNNILNRGELPKKDILANSKLSPSALNGLIQKNIFVEEEREISRLKQYEGDIELYHELSETQQDAYNKILEQFNKLNTVLLFGVTGCGKTEIYIKLIDKYLSQGKQVLYLLPEIVLTSQIIRRLQKVFGNKVGIYHSKISDMERAEIWKNLCDTQNPDSYKLIIGVRSSIFLPFSNLGLIIVDEEHENSYKQFDPQPRYNARDLSVVLAGMHGAKVLLGSATPSFESYFNAQNGKYGLVEIYNRFGSSQMPDIQVIDTRQAARKGLMRSLFSQSLLKHIGDNIQSHKQTILFRNRRGFSPYVECNSCGWIPKCENCDVTLTYHKRENRLVCHHCGYAIDMPHKCFACGDNNLSTKGFGTEQVEDEIKVFFPDAKISRLDADVSTSRNKFEQIIYEFEQGYIDILTGTQMISKGFDFKNLTLCGILNADSMLFFPDFRAEERTFQQLTQVSGRTGRTEVRGKVIIQSSNPENQVFTDVANNDYKGFYKRSMSERSRFAYPPYTKLVKIQVKHKDEPLAMRSAFYLANLLRQTFGGGVLGPEPPVISKLQNFYIQEILLKISKKYYGSTAKKIIMENINSTKAVAEKSGLIISVNVDPM